MRKYKRMRVQSGRINSVPVCGENGYPLRRDSSDKEQQDGGNERPERNAEKAEYKRRI